MTIEENLINMEKCPRFEDCSIPRCPLDFWIDERVELPEDDQCPGLKLIGKKRMRKSKVVLSSTMKKAIKLVRVIKESNPKMA